MAKVNTFNVEVSIVFEVFDKACLVCFIYKTRRGERSTKVITPHSTEYDIIIIQVVG